MEMGEDERSGNTPSKKSIKLDTEPSSGIGQHFTPKEKMPPPPMANVQIKAKNNKKINKATSAWKTLSLNRKVWKLWL